MNYILDNLSFLDKFLTITLFYIDLHNIGDKIIKKYDCIFYYNISKSI